MMHVRCLLSVLVGLSLIAAAGAMAAEPIAKGTQVPVISGGIGQESLARLKAREKEFNLKLVFALAEGNYLADVGVTVSDASGKVVVDHVTDGPVLLARLPAGTYTVIARYEGRIQTRKVTLRSEPLLTEHLRWPSDPRVDFPGPGNGRKSEPPSRPEAGRTATTTPRESAAPSAVAFISGGIGEASQAQLLAREKEFNLKLVFTLVEGNYVTDTRVEIREASGRTVVAHVADGPFLLVRLPAGIYSVTAGYEGQTQTRKMTVVTDRLHTEYIRWKSDPQRDWVLPPER